ncbi:MAG: peptide-methionine (S)-S-oxide reductase MsrA [Planctomycetaceae bacterium]|nr:peptide-methionine (S)-S-oxide reductase MsrA [Planctomycetaceae bacterium]
MAAGRTVRRLLGAVLLALAAGATACSSGEGPAPAPVPEPAPAPRPSEGGTMPAAERRETVILAGGCFWGMEELLRAIPGVLETEVGYSGGTVPDATYEIVKKGKSGHAEAVRVVFDPARLPFEDLLGWFFRMHDPTTLDRQGNDVGTQYRSAIFCTNGGQRAAAERVKAAVDRSGKWRKPIVTRIEEAGPWYPAEEYHQDYLRKNPGGYTCHWIRD